MKAKELAKFLLQHPEAEIVIDVYIGTDVVTTIEEAVLVPKGKSYPGFHDTYTPVINKAGTCKVDVIKLSRK